MFATCTSVPDKAKAPHAYRWYIHIAAIKGVRRYGTMSRRRARRLDEALYVSPLPPLFLSVSRCLYRWCILRILSPAAVLHRKQR